MSFLESVQKCQSIPDIQQDMADFLSPQMGAVRDKVQGMLDSIKEHNQNDFKKIQLFQQVVSEINTNQNDISIAKKSENQQGAEGTPQNPIQEVSLSNVVGMVAYEPHAYKVEKSQPTQDVTNSADPLNPEKSQCEELGPKWGATEGGLDTLSWVRDLITYTERHQVWVPDGVQTDPQQREEQIKQSRQTQFNNLKASNRRDVFLVKYWLQDMLHQLQFKSKSVEADKVNNQRALNISDQQGVVMANAALWVYGLAFEEIRRQIATECKQRAYLLGALWDHVFNLVEMRHALLYEQQVDAALDSAKAAQAEVEKEQAARQQIINEMKAKRQEQDLEHMLQRHQNKVLAQKIVKKEHEASGSTNRIKVLDVTLKQEVESRLELELQKQTMQEEYKKLQDTHTELKANNLLQNETLDKNKALIGDLRQQLADIRQQNRQNQTKIKAQNQENETLKEQLSESQQACKATEIMLVGVQGKLQTTEEQLEATRESEKVLQRKVKAGLERERLIKEQTGSLLQNFQDLKKEKTTVDQLYIQMKGDYHISQNKVATLEQILETAQVDHQKNVRKMQDEIRTLSSQLHLSNTEADRLENETVRLNEELSEKAAHVQSVQEGIDILQQTLEPLKMGNILDIVSAKQRSDEQVQRLKNNVEKSRWMIDNANQTVKGLQGKITGLEKTKKVQQAKIEAEEKSRNALNQKLLQGKNDLEYLRREKVQAQATVEQKEERLKHQDGILQATREREQTLTLTLSKVEKELEHANEDIQRLRPLEFMLRQAQAQSQELSKELDELQQKSEEQQNIIQKQEEEINDSQETLRSNRDTLVTLNQEIAHLGVKAQECVKVKQRYEQLKSDHNDLQMDLEDLNVENQRLQKQVMVTRMFLTGVQSDGDVSQEHSQALLSTGQQTPRSTASRPNTRVDNTMSTETKDKDNQLSPRSINSNEEQNTGKQSVTFDASVEDQKEDKDKTPRTRASSMISNNQNGGQSRDITQAADMWSRIKIGMLTDFSSRLRKKVDAMRLQIFQLQLDLEQKEYANVKNQIENMEQSSQVMTEIQMTTQSILKETLVGVEQANSDAKTYFPAMGNVTGVISSKVKVDPVTNEQTFITYIDRPVQCRHPVRSTWAGFMRSIPKEPHDQPLKTIALHEAIVRIYSRRLDNDEAYASDTGGIEDNLPQSVLDHYHHARGLPPLIMNAELLGSDGPVDRLLRSVRTVSTHHLKFKIFCQLAGMYQGYHLPSTSWSFMLDCLRCIRHLLQINWRPFLTDWSAGKPAHLPLQCVMDTLANAYNCNAPGKLKIVKNRIVPMLTDAGAGPCIPVDAFLMCMLHEHGRKRCPADPMSKPRRVTDGSTPAAGNLSGTPGSGLPQSPPSSQLSRGRPPSAASLTELLSVYDPEAAAAAKPRSKLLDRIEAIKQAGLNSQNEQQGSVNQMLEYEQDLVQKDIFESGNDIVESMKESAEERKKLGSRDQQRTSKASGGF